MDKDLNLDFMDLDRREKLTEFYLSKPRTLKNTKLLTM
jgi:hypothetical protein